MISWENIDPEWSDSWETWDSVGKLFLDCWENIDVGNSSANYIHLGKGKNDGAKKGKSKDKQKSKASGGKGQSSMDSFVSKDGKRPIGEILSPNDGKSGSPDQRKFKLDKWTGVDLIIDSK